MPKSAMPNFAMPTFAMPKSAMRCLALPSRCQPMPRFASPFDAKMPNFAKNRQPHFTREPKLRGSGINCVVSMGGGFYFLKNPPEHKHKKAINYLTDLREE